MSMKTAKGKDALFTEINITPLTDIFLVLLIIMMVVAPTFQSNDKSINVPEINSGTAIEQQHATVAVTKEGVMYLNGKKIKPEELTDGLLAIKNSLAKKEVVVRADEKAKSSEIMKIMDSAKDAEFTKLTLAGEPLSKKEQKKLQSGNPEKLQPKKHENWVE
jgi:biopolymer transport protein ExbD